MHRPPEQESHCQAPNTGLLNPFDWLRSEGEKRLAMLQQLHAPVVDLLSDAEQKRMLNANKVSTVMSLLAQQVSRPKLR